MQSTTQTLILTLALLVAGSTAQASDQHDGPTVPVTVSDTGMVDVAAAVEPWNRLTGRTLFQVVPDGQVVWVASDAASWTSRDGDRCTIHLDRTLLHVAQHELGHCLGFADHITTPDEFGRDGLQVCDDPQHAQFSPYSGVMSYCDWSDRDTWWGDDDVAMVQQATFGPTPWAAEVWAKAEAAGMVNDQSDPHATLTKQELMAFFDRAGLLD